jgi:hypothetical protein
MNPGAEPENRNSFDWALWYGQMCSLHHLGGMDMGTAEHVKTALTWLGEIRIQQQGWDEEAEAAIPGGAWPDDSLLGVLESLIPDPPFRDPAIWDLPAFPPRNTDSGSLAYSLYWVRKFMLECMGAPGRPEANDVIMAMARIYAMSTFEFPVNHVWAEEPSLVRSMSIWIRG